MQRGKQLTIVNPVREQEPFHHPEAEADGEIALHWDGIGPRSGVRSAWVSLIELHPGKASTFHAHPTNDEFFVVVAGRGVAREQTQEGPVEYEIEPYDIVMAPRGVPKQVANTGDASLMLVQIYAPAPAASTIAEVVENDELAVHWSGQPERKEARPG
jgi:mannose-6-phosphate isomerase-like protein (cupin superfamily)